MHFTVILKTDRVRSAVGERNKFKVQREGYDDDFQGSVVTVMTKESGSTTSVLNLTESQALERSTS